MKRQLYIAFIIIISIFGIGTGAVIKNLLNSTASLKHLINLHEIEDIRQDLNLRVQKVQAYVLLPSLDFSYNIDDVIETVSRIETAANNCHGCHHDPSVQKELEYTNELIADFEEKLSYIITTAEDVDWRKQNQQQAIKLSNTIITHTQNMVTRAAATLQHKTDAAMNSIQKSYTFLIVSLFVTFALTMVIAPYLIRKITAPIKELQNASKKIAAGELGHMTNLDTIPEFIELINSFNQMSKALAEKEQENRTLYADLEKQIIKLKNTQHQLVVAGKLASLGKLAGGIAHDFNNILCGIVGHTNLLSNNFPKGSYESETLKTIHDASFRASRLVDKLMTFARLQDWREVPVDVNQLLQEVYYSLKEKKTTRSEIKLTLADNLAEVKGDPDRFKELFLNICLNALQSLEDSGSVEVQTANVQGAKIQTEESRLMPEGQYVNIKVTDNGKGIPSEVLPKVFDPYFSTQQLGSQKGMGLGMAIAFSIVRKHEGYLTVESTEGVGTTVNIYLPAIDSPTNP